MVDLITEAEKHVVHLLNDKLESAYLYHNLAHTQRVVEKANELAELSNLGPSEKELLLLSTWFHDTGYTEGEENHEEASTAIAEAFLKKHNYPEKDIATVCHLILATKMVYSPKNQLEKIIRDADCSHIGSKNYEEVSSLLRKECSHKSA